MKTRGTRRREEANVQLGLSVSVSRSDWQIEWTWKLLLCCHRCCCWSINDHLVVVDNKFDCDRTTRRARDEPAGQSVSQSASQSVNHPANQLVNDVLPPSSRRATNDHHRPIGAITRYRIKAIHRFHPIHLTHPSVSLLFYPLTEFNDREKHMALCNCRLSRGP